MRSPAEIPSLSTLGRLPAEVNRSRVLSSEQAAELLGFSLAHFRRLYRAGSVPKPIKLGERKLGWKLGVLTDWIDAKSAEQAA